MRARAMTSSFGWPFMAALALAGCRREEPTEPEQPAGPTETVAPAPAENPSTSILRPEIQPEPMPPSQPEPLEVTIPFAEGGYKLDDRAERALADVADSVQLTEGWPIVLRGHTDSVGGDRANLLASERRAEAVAAWLVEQGVPEERITVIPLGEQRPVAPNAHLDGTPDEEGRAKNRRVTLTIAPPPAQEAENEPLAEEPETTPGG